MDEKESIPMLPNFLIVGAAKAGTTSLHEYLNQHPDVFIPDKKECLFFSALDRFNGPDHDQELNRLIIRDVADYEALFDDAKGVRARGDVSHDYLYYHDAAIPRIKSYLGDDVPIAMILRDPRERAYSHYMHHVKGGISPDSTFEQALANEDERVARGWSWNWHYKRAGLYADQVSAYLEAFPNVRVYLYEDLIRDGRGLIRSLYAHIGVDPCFEPVLEVHNRGYDIRNRRLNRFLKRENGLKEGLRALLLKLGVSAESLHRAKRRVLAANSLDKAKMSRATRDRLTEYFYEDVNRLERLLDRDLQHWKE